MQPTARERKSAAADGDRYAGTIETKPD